MKIFFKKTILLALVAALGLASLPLVNVFAAGQKDPTTPPQTFLTNDRLELVWARQLRVYNRLGRIDRLTERIQRLIDRAKANGKDVSAVQAALDAFETQWKEAKPTYDSITGIVNSHQGFDTNGQVTDTEKAKATVMEMRDKFKEIRETLNGTGKALREAIQAFREANPRPQPTVTP
jgi:gas vesicle protein